MDPKMAKMAADTAMKNPELAKQVAGAAMNAPAAGVAGAAGHPGAVQNKDVSAKTVAGAMAVGAVAGTVVAGTTVGVVAAGAMAYGAMNASGPAGDMARKAGDMGVAAGKNASEFNKKHDVTGKIGSGLNSAAGAATSVNNKYDIT